MFSFSLFFLVSDALYRVPEGLLNVRELLRGRPCFWENFPRSGFVVQLGSTVPGFSGICQPKNDQSLAWPGLFPMFLGQREIGRSLARTSILW